MSSARRWALMHELRGADEPRLPELAGEDVAGRSRRRRRASSASRTARSRCIAPPMPSRCCFPTIPALSASPPMPRLKPRCRSPISMMSPAVAAMMQRAAITVEDVLAKSVARAESEDGATVRRLLCLRRPDDVGGRGRRPDRRARRRRAGRRDRGACRGRRPHSRARHSGAAAAAAFHQFRRRWLCGASRDLPQGAGAGISRDRARAGRRLGASADQARSRDAHFHGRADARGRRHRLHAGGRPGRRRARSCCRPA